MRFSLRPCRMTLLAILAGSPAVVLAVDYNEGVDGDLSGVAASPTSLGALGLGAHNLTATSGGGDFDMLTFSLASGMQLDSLVVNDYSGSSLSFVDLAGGTTWPMGTGDSIDPATLLGWTHYSTTSTGTSIHDDIGVGAGAVGFTPPLPAGDYTVELQDTGAAVSYSMTFNVTPEPSSLLLAALAFFSFAAWRWKCAA